MSNWPLITAISSGVVRVAGADLIDRRAAVEQRARRVDVALPRGVQQRGQAALARDRRVDLFRIEVVRGARRVRSLPRRPPSSRAAESCRTRTARATPGSPPAPGSASAAGPSAPTASSTFRWRSVAARSSAALLGDVDRLRRDRADRRRARAARVIASARFCAAANISGVWPHSASLALASAPRSSSSLTTSALPAAAARCSGVTPVVVVRAATLAPALSSAWTTARCPPGSRGGAACTGRCA